MCLHPGAIRARIGGTLRQLGWVMVRFSAGFILTLPVAASITAAPALAQYTLPPPGAYYEERLPPAVGGYYDDDEDVLPPPRRGARPRPRPPTRVPPPPDEEPPLPPPTGLFGAPDQRPAGYGGQLNPQQPRPQQPAAPGAPVRATNDPDVLRPPAAIGAAPQGPAPSVTAALPPDYQPETGQPKELPANLKK